MSLFSSDPVLIEKIATELSACGCCARCTLRYLGLKDMHLYKGSLKDIEEKVREYKQGIAKENDKNDSAIEIGEPNRSETVTNTYVTNIDTKSETVASNNELTSNSELKLNNGDTCSDAATKETGDSVLPGKCVDKIEAEQCKQGTACSVSSEDDTSQRMAFISEGDKQAKTPPCIVCLGILQNFCSEEYLNKLKEQIMHEGFHYSTYLCSLTIPVCIILREYALMLHLKEMFRSVYGSMRYTNVAQIKDVWKWRCGPLLTDILGAPFDFKSKFEITMTFQYEHSSKECSFLLDTEGNDTFRKRKQDRRCKKKNKAFALYTRGNVAKATDEMPEQEFRRNYQCPPIEPRSYTKCDVKCQNENVFVAGRYNKYSRTLSQTPWLIDGVSKTETSVEELLEMEIRKNFRPSEFKFSSSGREDVDVLMLGNGRPFVLELVNPRRREFTQQEMTSMQEVMNSNTIEIKCSDLQIVTKEETDILKEGEIDKVKKYRALCWSKLPVTDEQLTSLSNKVDLKLLQKTPIRVLHRRPLSTRARMIHKITAERVDKQHFRLDLSTQAGTYVKEFVHGDFGRTKPNVSTLLAQECDILELDVTAVELNWPKKIEGS